MSSKKDAIKPVLGEVWPAADKETWDKEVTPAIKRDFLYTHLVPSYENKKFLSF